MTHEFDDHELVLLRQYDSPIPSELRNNLHARMLAQLSRRTPRWQPAAAGMALAACVGVIAWLAATPAAPAPPRIGIRSFAQATTPVSPQDGYLGFNFATTTFDDSLARSPLILLVKIDAVRDMTADCTILKTIYGNTAEKTLQIDLTCGDAEIRRGYEKDARAWFSRDHDRAPNDAELLVQMQYMHSLNTSYIGIVMLAPPDANGKTSSAVQGKTERYDFVQTHFFAPTTNSPVKQQLADALRNGIYLRPNPIFVNEPLLEPKLAAAEAIVRAKLTATTDTQSTWHIDNVIKGKPLADVTIPHDLFDQRARALATIASIDDHSLDNPEKFAQRVRKEREDLIKTELPAGQEAILLLADIKSAGNTTQARLQGRDLQTTPTNLTTTQNLIEKALAKLERHIASPASLPGG